MKQLHDPLVQITVQARRQTGTFGWWYRLAWIGWGTYWIVESLP